jgi:hypothetical protein
MSKKGKFIIITHVFLPNEGARTEMKDFGKTNQMSAYENVVYTDRVKKYHMDSASTILNLETLEFEKNRVQEFTVKDCLQYLQNQFPNEYPTWFDGAVPTLHDDKADGK